MNVINIFSFLKCFYISKIYHCRNFKFAFLVNALKPLCEKRDIMSSHSIEYPNYVINERQMKVINLMMSQHKIILIDRNLKLTNY